jgi:hypothetical protein
LDWQSEELNEALSYEPSDYDWSDEDDALDVIFQKYRQESNKKKKQKYLQKFAKGVEGNSSDVLSYVDTLKEDLLLDDGKYADLIVAIFVPLAFIDPEFLYYSKDALVTAAQLNATAKKPLKKIATLLEWKDEKVRI